MNSRITYLLIGLNVLIFLVESAMGGSRDTKVALRFGAMYTPYVRKGQWYRLFSSMFLHFGFFHLICNMYSLYCLGPGLEYIMGTAWFLVVYIVSGLIGNLLTYNIETLKHRYAISAGASGAIFGLLGAYLVLALSSSGYGGISVRNIVYVLIVNLLYGLSNRGTNNYAHLGGLAGGAVITLLLIHA